MVGACTNKLFSWFKCNKIVSWMTALLELLTSLKIYQFYFTIIMFRPEFMRTGNSPVLHITYVCQAIHVPSLLFTVLDLTLDRLFCFNFLSMCLH